MIGSFGKTLSFFVAGFALAGVAQAAPVAIACNACSQATVLQLSGNLGRGIHFFYDLAGNAIYKVRTDCEPGAGGTTVCTSTPAAVPTNIASAFATYRSAVVANGNSERFKAAVSISLPSASLPGPDGLPMDDGHINAWDTIINSNYNSQVITRLSNPSTYSGAYGIMMSVLGPLNNPVVNFDQMNGVVDVQFPDGSVRSYKFNKDTAKYEPILGSAKDSHINTLPDDPNHPTPPNSTQYVFTGLPGWNSYDYRNIFFYLNPHGSPAAHGCEATRWDGQNLTCIHPY